MIAHRLRMAVFAFCVLVPVASHAGPYDSIVVFGDSLSDAASDLALSTPIQALNPAFPFVPGSGVGGNSSKFDLFNQVVANAASFGFSDTTGACLNGSAYVGSTVTAACAAAGPNSYLFWEGVRSTTHAQQILDAPFALAVGIPEPSEMSLLFIGLLALVALVRRGFR